MAKKGQISIFLSRKIMRQDQAPYLFKKLVLGSLQVIQGQKFQKCSYFDISKLLFKMVKLNLFFAIFDQEKFRAHVD